MMGDQFWCKFHKYIFDNNGVYVYLYYVWYCYCAGYSASWRQVLTRYRSKREMNQMMNTTEDSGNVSMEDIEGSRVDSSTSQCTTVSPADEKSLLAEYALHFTWLCCSLMYYFIISVFYLFLMPVKSVWLSSHGLHWLHSEIKHEINPICLNSFRVKSAQNATCS